MRGVIDSKKLENIAEAIRNCTGTTKTYSPEKMPKGIIEVYNKGMDEGYTDGYNQGFEHGEVEGIGKGKEQERSFFWGKYQGNGNAINYAYAFYGSTWTDELYKPLKQIDGVDITFKVYTTCNGMYQGTYITDTLIPIDISGASVGTNTTYMFYSASRLKKINKLIVKESNVFTSAFGYCKALTDIEFEGTIGRDISFSDCSDLTAVSLKNIVKHLKDCSGTNPTYTLTLHSSCWTRLANEGNTAPNGKDWRTYAEEKGWLTE